MSIAELLAANDEQAKQTMNLYHGSGFKQTELKPGFAHTGELVNWDRYESNDYLYASSHKNSAILLGIVSAWEKKFPISRTKIDEPGRQIRLEFEDKVPSPDDLNRVDAWLYTIARDDAADGWVHNHNPFNNIKTEYKTKSTIKKNILSIEKINIESTLKGFVIHSSVAK